MFAAGGPSVSAHRRSLVTATAAGAVLCALWFVPTAKAVPEAPGAANPSGSAGSASAGSAGGAHQSAPAVPASAQPDPGSPPVPSASAHAAPPPAVAEGGFTSPFALSALGLASAGGFLIVRACSRTARTARPGAGSAEGGDPR